ncbi:MAG: periplasmic heavy metal sensor [Elusimicrobia bacterium]|nr:periplasmic heavy metal sensor [Elusimicrobiota bacterium]
MRQRNSRGQEIVLCGILSIFLMTPAVWARPFGERRGSAEDREEQGRRHFAQMSEKLNLSAEQQAQLDENRRQHKTEFDELMASIEDKREELRVALESPWLDQQRVTAIHEDLKKLMNKKEDLRLAAILSIRDILTPEQFVRFQEMAPGGKRPPPGGPEEIRD